MATAIPAEVCARVARLSTYQTHEAITELTGVSLSSLTNLKKRGFEPRPIGRRRKPMPGDFRIQANHMPIDELLKHYGVSATTLHGWLAQIDRDYTPRPQPDKTIPLLPRAEIEAAIAKVGATEAHRLLGIAKNTLQRMREAYGMPVKKRVSAKMRAEGYRRPRPVRRLVTA